MARQQRRQKMRLAMRKDNHPVEQEEVMAYLDGELPIEEAARAAAHLEACRECQTLAAELKDVSQSLTAWEIEPYDPQVKVDVAAALDERKSTKAISLGNSGNWFAAFLERRWAPFAAIAGAAALLVSALVLAPDMSHHAAPQMAISEAQSGADQDRFAVSRHAITAVPSPKGGVVGGVVGRVPDGVPLGMQAQMYQSQAAPPSSFAGTNQGKASAVQRAPMIARTAELTLTTNNFEKARSGIDEVLRRHQGYVGDLNVASPAVGQRRLTATLRVPADQLGSTLAELKTLGRVELESQRGEEITAQFVDLEARLANARTTEKRLTELERQQTGKLSEVLEVETEISRVRGEIESMEAERKLLTTRVDFATITTTLTEEFKAQAQLVPNSLGTRFRNATIDGYQSVVNDVVELLLFLVSYGPSILLWGALIFFPTRFFWRRWKRKTTS